MPKASVKAATKGNMHTVPKTSEAEPPREQVDTSTPVTVVEAIDPARAYEYLETGFKKGSQVRNRGVSQAKVKEYASAMRRGEWTLTDQGIGFDIDGILRNGQHRMWAVIEAGCTIRTNVTRGLAPKFFDVVDTGLRRSARDVLSIHGEANATVLQAALTWQWRQDTGRIETAIGAGGASNQAGRPSHDQYLDTLDRHPDIRQSVSILNTFPSGIRRILPPGLFVWLHYQFSAASALDAHEFFDKLRTGQDLDPMDPVYLLRERLIQNMALRGRRDQVQLAALAIKAWNLKLAGQTRQQLAWRSATEAFPEVATRAA